MKFSSEFKHFHSRKCIWKCRLENGGHFVPVSMGLGKHQTFPVIESLPYVQRFCLVGGGWGWGGWYIQIHLTIQPVIPLKSIPMSRHLPEMRAECQTLHIWLLLTAPTLRWHCADFNCLFSWLDYVTESALTQVSTEYFTDTIVTMRVDKDAVDADILVNHEVLTFYVRRVMPRSVNHCISSVMVLPLIWGIWMIYNCHRYDFYQWIKRLWVSVVRQMWRRLNVATFVEIGVSGREKTNSWHQCQQFG